MNFNSFLRLIHTPQGVERLTRLTFRSDIASYRLSGAFREIIPIIITPTVAKEKGQEKRKDRKTQKRFR